MKNTFLYPLSILLICGLFSCVEELEIKQQTQVRFMVVDGILNFYKEAQANDMTIKLTESISVQIKAAPISKAKVQIIVDDKNTYDIAENSNSLGTYTLTNTSIFKVGSKYKLHIERNGQTYESDNQVLMDSVPLKNAYFDLNPKRTQETAFEIFVDAEDVPQQKNYYRWAITQWEKQEYCLFCYRGTRGTETCSEDIYATGGTTISRNPYCQGDCYDILRFTPNNSIADTYIDGKQIIKKPIGYVPHNFSRGCLIEVKQSMITPQYYAFLDVLKTQSENTGGLADTPPALLVGNVKNINDANEKVVGYFSVTNNSIKRFFLDKRTITQSYGFSSLSDVNPPLTPPTPTPSNWFPVPCKESSYRTPTKPWGWKD